MSLILNVPRALESRNEYNSPKGYWKLNSHKKIWMQILGEAFLIEKANGRIPPKYLPPCDVQRSLNISTYRKRLIDHDNLSIKALLDVLKRLEFIKDDSPKWIKECTVHQFSIGKYGAHRTEIEII